MVQIKSKREIELMREAGKRVAEVLYRLSLMVEPGRTTAELDAEAERLTRSLGAVPAFKGYLGFKHTLCVSVDSEVVHGVPSSTRKLEEGSIVGLDFGLVYQGFFGDSAITVPVGKISGEAAKLVQCTKDSLYAAIDASRPGNTLRDIAAAVEKTVNPFRYGIVREFVGHGIGQKLHEDPQVPNYSSGATALKLRPGMTIAIEPMITAGSPQVKILADRWTAVTCDGALAAHYEHTILITEEDPEILTSWSLLADVGKGCVSSEKGTYGERGPNPN